MTTPLSHVRTIRSADRADFAALHDAHSFLHYFPVLLVGGGGAKRTSIQPRPAKQLRHAICLGTQAADQAARYLRLLGFLAPTRVE